MKTQTGPRTFFNLNHQYCRTCGSSQVICVNGEPFSSTDTGWPNADEPRQERSEKLEVQQPKIYTQWDNEFKHNQKNPRHFYGRERRDVEAILTRAWHLNFKAAQVKDATFEVQEAVRELRNAHEPAAQCRAWQRIAVAVQQLEDRV